VLGPYNTSDSPITIVIVSLIVIVVPLLSPYYCYYAPEKPTIVIFVLLYYYCYVGLIILWPLRLLYIERRFCHLYHPRIFHLCNERCFPPRRGWFLSHWSIFYFILRAGCITLGIRALDSRVSLLQISHRGLFAITICLQCFRSRNSNPFELKSSWTSAPNFRSYLAIF